eukprot:1133485-Pyramimonas_sp.AAC.1
MTAVSSMSHFTTMYRSDPSSIWGRYAGLISIRLAVRRHPQYCLHPTGISRARAGGPAEL